jgi:hypothetical protein
MGSIKRNKLSRKKEIAKVDGLSKKDIAKIRSAIRVIWHRSYPRKLCVNRATGKDGFFRCEACLKKAPKICIDHKITVGDVDAGFIKRLFCPSSGLQALCVSCHSAKTKEERRESALKKRLGF